MDFRVWLELLARSTALLVAAELLLRLTRRAGAALRHRILLWTFVLLALLPVLGALLPAIPLSLPGKASEPKAIVTVIELPAHVRAAPVHPQVNWLLWIWAAGLGIAVLPLVTGAFSVSGIARRATPFSAAVSLSDELRVPITCGIFRPRILLPAEAAHWSPSRLQAVLLHERAHIRRGDVAVQVAAHIVAALWWFQPLAWWLRWRLRNESEFAADAEAVQSGVRASDYAFELLAVAKGLGSSLRISASSLAMVRPGSLEHRLGAVLYPAAPALWRGRIWVLALLLGSAAVAASAIDVGAPEGSDKGGSTMKRALFSALLTSAGLSAATIGGTVHDAGGSPVPDAKVTVTNPDTGATEDVSTAPDGKFLLSGKGAGQYILRIEKPGFASLFREFDMGAESNVDREFTMPSEGGQPAPDVVLGGGETAKVRIGGQVAQANLLQRVQPVYPAAAKANHVQGTVELETVISKDGVPAEIRVLSSPSDELSASSLEAVRQWRYRPTLLNGHPVEVMTTVVIHYTLSE